MAQLTGFYLIHGSHIFIVGVGRRRWRAMRVESNSICLFHQLYSQNAPGGCPGEFWLGGSSWLTGISCQDMSLWSHGPLALSNTFPEGNDCPNCGYG